MAAEMSRKAIPVVVWNLWTVRKILTGELGKFDGGTLTAAPESPRRKPYHHPQHPNSAPPYMEVVLAGLLV